MMGNGRGAILLVTLWMLAILSLLAIGLGIRSSVDLRLVGYQIDSLKAYEIAKAGLIKAINELERDDKTVTDTIWECGISLKEDETFDGEFKNIRVGAGYFDVSFIEDLQAKININSAPKGVLMELLAPAANAGELADNIRAWRGDTAQDVPPTAKEYAGRPYQCKNAPFDSVCELLRVKDITREIYDGADGSGGLKELVTVYGPEELKVNINTADQKTLEVLLGAAGLDASVAANIIEHRGGSDKNIETIDDNVVFTEPKWLEGFFSGAEGEGLDPNFSNFSKMIVFKSDYFKVRSIGRIERRKSVLRKTITSAVKRGVSTSGPHKTELIGWLEE